MRALGRGKPEIHHSDQGCSTQRPLTGFRLEVAGHAGGTVGVVRSPDGRRPATSGSDGMVRLWSPSTGELLAALDGHSTWLWRVAFSADGRILAAADSDDHVRVWHMDEPRDADSDRRRR